MAIKFFPFGRGLHQENDQRLNDAGSPRAVENLVRTKNGRLQPRRDYETIAMTGTGSLLFGTGQMTNLRLYDLAEYSGRLLGFGRADGASMLNYATDGLQNVYELLEGAAGNWRRAPTGELVAGTQARMVGRVGRKPNSVLTLDLAAGNGLVCMVFDTQIGLPGSAAVSVGVHVFDPETDETIFTAGISGAERGRVVCVNGTFHIGYVVTATNAIALTAFNPTNPAYTLSPPSTPVAAGAAVTAWDMSAGADTATIWIAVARVGAATEIRGLDASQVVTYTAAGPAVLFDGISIFNHTVAGVNRFHLAGVVNATLAVNLYTYIPPALVPAVTSAPLGGGLTSSCQVGLALHPTTATDINVTVQETTATVAPITTRGINIVTHANSGGQSMRFANINSKTFTANNRHLVGAIVQEELGYFTHMLLRNADSGFVWRPVAVFDRFLGHQLTPFHLPSIAHDASTDYTYLPVSTEDSDRRCNAQALRLRIAGQERRQTVQLGDVLYIAGSIVMAFDGRFTQEAGGFLTRPFIYSSSQQNTGALDFLGTYQTIAVGEFRDAKNRRIQSAPSNLLQVTLTGAFDQITARAVVPVSFRDMGNADFLTPSQMQSAPSVTFYRTLNVNNGNGTFHLDVANPIVGMSNHDDTSGVLAQSDVDISDEEVLYTQGARGALSGPLEFVCPDGAGALCASADRILTAQLINPTQIQESRPLFPGEQAQWNDTAGFFRDIRDNVLACARLDERRILFTADQLYECDGPGLDDNGLGDIGAPRRLPSDVGLYGGVLGWRSIVEMSAGIMFQGNIDQIYLLPRGGVTPIAIGDPVEDTLLAYPDISAAVYMPEDKTVRFCCNNLAGTESVILLFDVRFGEWFVEQGDSGPYPFTIRSAAKADGRFYVLTSLNTLLRQRTSDVPLTFVPFAHRSSPYHTGQAPGMFGDFEAAWIYGTYNGPFQLRCIVKFDERDTETSEWVDIVGLTPGAQFVHRFGFDQRKCESCMVDFEVRAFQGQAVQGPHLTYWAVEGEPSKMPNEVGPEDMT